MEYPEYCTLSPNHCREIYIKIHYKEFHQYLISNYPEELSFGERLYWFYNNINDYPKCKNCGKRTKFINALYGYNEYCCVKCSNSSKEKITQIKQTNQIKFGGNAPACSKEVVLKMKQTNLERYGDENFNNRTKANKTLLERYNGIGNGSEIIKAKQQKTMIDKYGKENPMFIDNIKDKVRANNMKKYGVEWVTQREDVKRKSIETCLERYGSELDDVIPDNAIQLNCVKRQILKTKKKNKTFNSSSIEKQFEAYLKENNINYITQYKSELYPFYCDFYFPDNDLYLEINGHWTHGGHPGHPFDSTNKDDLLVLEQWKKQNTKFYDIAINVWTERDVLKRETAKKNNLNYLEVFTTNINVLIDEYKRAIKRL